MAKEHPHFTAYSAGSHPSGTVRPQALRQSNPLVSAPKACAANPGMSLPGQMRLISTSSSPSAITPQKKCVPSGPANPSPRTGAWQTPLLWLAHRKKLIAPTRRPSPRWTDASHYCSHFRSRPLIPSPSRRISTPSAASSSAVRSCTPQRMGAEFTRQSSPPAARCA